MPCCPEGTIENSPAFQRWVGRQKVASPGGTAEVQSHAPSFNRPFGTCVACRMFPGVKTPGYSQDVPPGQKNVAATFSATKATRFTSDAFKAHYPEVVGQCSLFLRESLHAIFAAPVPMLHKNITSKSRRSLVLTLLAWAGVALAAVAREPVLRSEANVVVELAFKASLAYSDPFNEVTLDVIFIDPRGRQLRVPAFLAGTNVWKVRYASPEVGKHRFRSECSVARDGGLHGVAGEVDVKPYRGQNPLYAHGPLRVASNRRYLEHTDGTPFFWLGDTWWMGLCHRLHWPDEFQTLVADRKEKGFNVIQIVAGLYPDMPPFDPRGANEAGFPWETNYARIRPEYFDAADRRIEHLVEEGFTPCIVGAWGYFIPWMGVGKAEQHWRYLIARYGAMPVVWCVAGEANLPYYLAKGFPYDDRAQVRSWTEVTRYVREIDPFHRLITIHPTGIGRLSARNATDDILLLDIDMLQTPHGQREAVPPTVRTVRESYADQPVMPVINGEASYEMLNDKIPARWPRAMFWICMLNGAAGHTYGANGIWQCNRRDQPHGASPHGGNYGKISWDEAMRLAGSRQVALGKKLLEQYPWHRFTPHPEWAAFAGETGVQSELDGPQAAGIPGTVRIVWVPRSEPIVVHNLGSRAAWAAAYFDPVIGERKELGEVRADDTGLWRCEPPAGHDHDWLLILEGKKQATKPPRRQRNRRASSRSPTTSSTGTSN